MAIDSAAPRSRRSLLLGVVGAVAGVAASSLSGVQRALAAADDGKTIKVGDSLTAVSLKTTIVNNTNNDPALRLGNNNAGAGLEAFSWAHAGVWAQSAGIGSGVVGYSANGTGIRAAHGMTPTIFEYPAALLGELSKPKGVALQGNNYASTGVAQGVQGTSDSNKGLATTGWARNGGAGIVGVSGHSKTAWPTVPNEVGGYFKATAGRGVVAVGAKAQVRLVPSTLATHPTSGSAGDLFVDKSKRLWYCKGATSWTRLA